MGLSNAVQTRALGVNTLPDELNALVPALVARFNSEVAPRLLSRLPSETLPESARAASSFRSRVSLLVEYSLIEMLADFIREDSAGLHVTFNATNEFGDFFVRGADWDIDLRIDVKTLHDLSAEASARYDTPASAVDPFDDYLLYVAWQWRETQWGDNTVVYPALIDALFVPAVEIVYERDKRQILAGGSFAADGTALARSGLKDSNFGKFNRIVHPKRRGTSALEPRIRRFLELLQVQAEARKAVPPSMASAEALADDSDDVTAATDEA